MTPDDAKLELERFLSDHPGHPLGPGAPTGSSLRIEFFDEAKQAWRGESHLQAWERIVRLDPCSYCGELAPAGTVDHIEAKSRRVRGIGRSAFTWVNLTGACESCNNAKGQKPLLEFMRKRASSLPQKVALKSEVSTLGQLPTRRTRAHPAARRSAVTSGHA